MLLLLSLLLSVCLCGCWCRAGPCCAGKYCTSIHAQEGEPKHTCTMMPDQKLRKMASHSLSSWSYNVMEYPSMCPRWVHNARCDADSACEGQGWRSVPITSSVPVLYWLGAAGAQQPCWQPGLFNITTGCTCVSRTAP